MDFSYENRFLCIPKAPQFFNLHSERIFSQKYSVVKESNYLVDIYISIYLYQLTIGKISYFLELIINNL